MTQIDQIIADALAGSPETHVAILAREVLRLREAPAVVVPELTKAEADSLEQIAIDQSIQAYGGWDWARLIMFGYSLAASRSRAIPADRVLGEGMVAVDLAELEALREFHDAYTEDGECDLDEFLQKMNSISGKIAAIRASQGGVNHG